MGTRRGAQVVAMALVVAGGAAACSTAATDDEDADSGRHRVDGSNHDLAPYGNLTLSVDCSEGEVATSGGTWSNYPDVEVTWTDVTDTDTYAAAFLNPTGDVRRVGVYVLCEDR